MIRIVILLIFITSFGCASTTSPGGGPRDEIPPHLLSSQPSDQAVNVNTSQIILEFDERVDLNNYLEEILITPRLKYPLEAIAKKNRVILDISDTLLDNTTYTIAFRESIRDITENNPAENLKIAFSTGSYIDSAYISGTVVSLMKQEPLKEVMVGAYFADDTLSILNQAPDYLTISKEDGSYELTNLKQGKYKLYALKDQNKNSILDFKTESYGFITDTLALDTSFINLEIPLVYNDRRPLALQSARNSGKYFLLRYNKFISNYIIDSIDSLSSRVDDDFSGIKFYNTLKVDSTEIFAVAFDTLGYSSSRDTIMLKFPDSPRPAEDYSHSIKSQNIILGSNEVDLTVKFNKPSRFLTNDSIYIVLDSSNSLIIDDTLTKWNKTRTELSLRLDLDSVLNDSMNISRSKFITGSQSFISVENDTSDRLVSNLKWIKTEDTGAIEVEVKTTNKSFFVQLLDQKYNVIQVRNNTDKFSFDKLSPGNYIVRILIDENNDGKWSAGDIYKGIPPEKVIVYTKSDGTRVLNLKANWILGPHEFIID